MPLTEYEAYRLREDICATYQYIDVIALKCLQSLQANELPLMALPHYAECCAADLRAPENLREFIARESIKKLTKMIGVPIPN